MHTAETSRIPTIAVEKQTHDKLREIAKANRRTVSGEVRALIDRAIAEAEVAAEPEPTKAVAA